MHGTGKGRLCSALFFQLHGGFFLRRPKLPTLKTKKLSLARDFFQPKKWPFFASSKIENKNSLNNHPKSWKKRFFLKLFDTLKMGHFLGNLTKNEENQEKSDTFSILVNNEKFMVINYPRFQHPCECSKGLSRKNHQKLMFDARQKDV